MVRSAGRPFSVSVRVQLAGAASLAALPVVLGLLVWALVSVSAAPAVAVGLAFTVGLQVAVARRWGRFRSRPSTRRDAPALFDVVERICSAADLALPKIVVHEQPYANSWITGVTARRTTLHLTRGLIELLDERQLGAVIAHELSHVRQKDSALMSLAATPFAAMSDGASAYFHAYGDMRRAWQNRRTLMDAPAGDEGDSAGLVAEGLSIWAFVWLLLLPLALLFLALGTLCSAITAVFSRARELEADAGAALLTGNPAALSAALIALSTAPRDLIPRTDLRAAASLDVFHIVAMSDEHWPLRTHPTLDRRLAQLSTIEARLQHPDRD